MSKKKRCQIVLIGGIILFLVVFLNGQEKGVNSINVEEMAFHLRFLSAEEFQGRWAPSFELKIASRYIALLMGEYGLQSLMPDGSYFQSIPMMVTRVSEPDTKIRVTSELQDQIFHFPKGFGIQKWTVKPGEYSGEIVFVGYGIEAPDLGWDDYTGMNLKNKIVVMLDGDLPEDHAIMNDLNSRYLWQRRIIPFQKGAVAVLSVISEERQKRFEERGFIFDNSGIGRPLDAEIGRPSYASGRPNIHVEIRHEVAAEILGISSNTLKEMFNNLKEGHRVSHQEIHGKKVLITVQVEEQKDVTSNVVAYLEGKDPSLKDEYVVFGAHHDHLGVREGKVFCGADDNISGTVALLEIAQAFVLERPRRSVVFVWNTAEEQGLLGSRHFVRHCPIPIEKISAQLNLDMLSRNDPESLYLVGSTQLSSELDDVLKDVNHRFVHMNLDYEYQDPAHYRSFFYRSDHYPFIEVGIPSVWLFCGTTQDYHQETDTADKANLKKMEKIARLTYLAGMEIGNLDQMLKLDINSSIRTRGMHNLSYDWPQRHPRKTK